MAAAEGSVPANGFDEWVVEEPGEDMATRLGFSLFFCFAFFFFCILIFNFSIFLLVLFIIFNIASLIISLILFCIFFFLVYIA